MEKNSGNYELSNNTFSSADAPTSSQAKREKTECGIRWLKGFFILAIITYYYFQHLLPGGFLAVNGFLVVGGYLTFRNNIKTFAEDYKERFPVRSLKRNVLPDALYDCRDGRVFYSWRHRNYFLISEAWRFRHYSS